MSKFISIMLQTEIGKPAKEVARKEHRVAKGMMRDAIADFTARGVKLRLSTDKRIVTKFGETLYLE